MRPEVLFPLFAPVTRLSGIGPRMAKLVEQAAGPRVIDLCWHLPEGLIDRRYAPALGSAVPGRVATLTVTVQFHAPAMSPRRPYKVICADDSGSLDLVFFHPRVDWLKRVLPEGAQRIVSGKIERFNDRLQMTHPDHIATLDERGRLATVEPVYGLTAGLSLKVLGQAVAQAVERAPELPDWLDPAYRERQSWPDWKAALAAAHQPKELEDLEPSAAPRRRLSYDELLANQLALGLIRAQQRRQRGRQIAGDGDLSRKVLAALPFALTPSQSAAIDDITRDMAGPDRMIRLLQGDVGSGKTVVALMSMMVAVEAGAQAALMAPTEILARQHHRALAPLARAAGVDVALLTGRDKGKARQRLLARLADGTTGIAVGTHALFQQDVAFKDLALVVVDEQHRFGVHQRLTLAGKGAQPDMLVMTATPIPRTLTLTVYGDMDVSKLLEKPAGRQPVITVAKPLSQLTDVVAAVGRAMGEGSKIYWVCPLVEESETSDLAAAEQRAEELRARFGDRVGLIHGRMKGPERDTVMEGFAEGDVDLLVATTVIEVGVDVPQATVMVIEHAERFGLAQLHQLRGRVGRGAGRSTCILLYQGPLGETARTRINVLRETDDGFRIAEEDLRLRGAGEVLGTRQSGLPTFKVADLAAHQDLLIAARDDARLILETDPELKGPRGAALRVLLYLFELDEGVRLLRSG